MPQTHGIGKNLPPIHVQTLRVCGGNADHSFSLPDVYILRPLPYRGPTPEIT